MHGNLDPETLRRAGALLRAVLNDLGAAAVVGGSGLDERAQAIIELARQTGDSEARKEAVINKMLDTYFPDERYKIYDLDYKPEISGLGTYNTGSGTSAKTKLQFGDYFLDQIQPDTFARRVLQLKHELIHCDQYRQGYTGDNYRVWREYRAHLVAGTAKELPGTGAMDTSMRITLIDASLGCFNCFSAATRNSADYKKNRDYLLAWRKYYYDRLKDPKNRAKFLDSSQHMQVRALTAAEPRFQFGTERSASSGSGLTAEPDAAAGSERADVPCRA